MSDAAIELRGLHKTYRRRKARVVALDGLDLRVERGEVFGLLGPNGAGKTTTVEVCLGITAPDAGEVTVLGGCWGSRRDRALRARLGVCLQETKFHDKQTVRETLELFAAFVPGGRGVTRALEVVSLTEKQHARQKELSGGQRQRLAVATALVGAPELLFLDEPTTGLDPQSRRQLWEVVRQFKSEGGTVLLTTHYMDEAYQLCDRVGIVDAGKVIALGAPDQLIRSLGAQDYVTCEVDGAQQLDLAALRDLPGVVRCSGLPQGAELTVSSVHVAVPSLLAYLASKSLPLRDLRTRHATLEDVFVQLTGRHLREDQR